MDNALLFKPLYEELFNSVKDVSNELWPFFPQQGSNWDLSEHRMLFIGKATNGWVTINRDVDLLFDPNEEGRIVNRDDEMDWVLDGWGQNIEGKYNTKKSSFWRVIKRITISNEKSCSDDNWASYISWSNLYKISFESGNPSSPLQKLQREVCSKILDLEIQILKPKNIIFFTSGWEWFYLYHRKSLVTQSQNRTTTSWGKNRKYESYALDLNGINCIISCHPERKPEFAHAEAICSLIK